MNATYETLSEQCDDVMRGIVALQKENERLSLERHDLSVLSERLKAAVLDIEHRALAAETENTRLRSALEWLAKTVCPTCRRDADARAALAPSPRDGGR